MNHYYKLVIPTTIYNVPAPAEMVEAIRLEIKQALASTFGGYTEYRATGGYSADSGELIEESVFVIEASFETPDDELIFQLAERIKAELQQESVMIRKDHEVFFV